MIYDLEAPLLIGRILLVIAAVTATIFPILYSRSAWFAHRLGRAVMIISVTTAVALWRSVFLTFFAQGNYREFFLWMSVVILIGIIVSTTKLSIVQWGFIRQHHEEEKRRE